MKITKYPYWDIYKCSKSYKTTDNGIIILFKYMVQHDWQKFFQKKRNILLDTTRWVNYMGNAEELLKTDMLSGDKALCIKVASYREIADYQLYKDKSINIDRIPKEIIDRVLKVPLIRKIGNKLFLVYED